MEAIRASYAANDPVNKSDPNGHVVVADDVAIAAAFATMLAIESYRQADLADDGKLNGSPLSKTVDQAKEAAKAVAVAVSSLASLAISQSQEADDQEDGGKSINPEVNEGNQGKHTPGKHNHDPDRSPIADDVDPGELIGGAIKGDYGQVGKGVRGNPVFDFGRKIGTVKRKDTKYGTIHSGKKGSQVVPANPDKYGDKDSEKSGEEDNEAEND